VIHPALLFLVRLRWRAMFRKAGRGLKSVRGAILFFFGLALFILWLLPPLIMSFRGEKGNIEMFEAIMPLGMLGMCLFSLMTSAGERAIYFSPGEVEFLFPGPFSRREVLAYKLLGTVLNVLLGSLIFSMFAVRYTSMWIAGYIGVALSLVFVQYFTMAAMLVGETMSQRAYTRARRLLLTGVGVVIAMGAGQVMSMRNDMRGENFLVLLRETPSLHYALLPLEPFVRTVTAPAVFPDLLGWAMACVAINGAMFFVIVWLDAEYRETAIRVSRRLYTRMQSAQRSGMASSGVRVGKLRIPAWPWLGGSGPIAWRQTVNVARHARSMMMIMVLLSVAIAIPAMRNTSSNQSALAPVLTMIIWLTVMLSMMVRFDFRQDIERMDWLKALPISPLTMATGQLLVPVLLCTAMQVALIALATYFMGRYELILMVLAFGLPTNLLMYSVENTMFLLMPTKSQAFSPGDFQLFGRQLLFLLVKSLVVGIIWGIALGAGALVYLLAGRNELASGLTTWTLLSVASIASITAVAMAFNYHDVSRDTPI